VVFQDFAAYIPLGALKIPLLWKFELRILYRNWTTT
jgi:hypothetical protein